MSEQPDVQRRYHGYLQRGGVFNPEHMEYQKVADLLSEFSIELRKTQTERDEARERLKMLAPAPDPVRGTPQPHRVADFLQKLPDMAAPEVLLEEDGDIGFDWFGPDNSVTISAHIGRDGNGGWSALIGDYKSFGRFSLDAAWPDDFLEALRRFNAATALVSGKQEEPTK